MSCAEINDSCITNNSNIRLRFDINGNVAVTKAKDKLNIGE